MKIVGKSPVTNNFIMELTPEELEMVQGVFGECNGEYHGECNDSLTAPSNDREQQTNAFLDKVYGVNQDSEEVSKPIASIENILNGTYHPTSKREMSISADCILDAFAKDKISKDQMTKLMNKIGF